MYWIVGLHSVNSVDNHNEPVIELLTRVLEGEGNLQEDDSTRYSVQLDKYSVHTFTWAHAQYMYMKMLKKL